MVETAGCGGKVSKAAEVLMEKHDRDGAPLRLKIRRHSFGGGFGGTIDVARGAAAVAVNQLVADSELTAAQKLGRLVALRTQGSLDAGQDFARARARVLAGATDSSSAARVGSSGETSESSDASSRSAASLIAAARAKVARASPEEVSRWIDEAADGATGTTTSETIEIVYREGPCGFSLYVPADDSTALVCQVTRGGQSEALGLRVGDEVLDMNECAYSPTSATNHCRACWCGCACVCVCDKEGGGLCT